MRLQCPPSRQSSTEATVATFVQNSLFFRRGSSPIQKQKDLVNLCHHEQDFGISAEWHFYATAHGKSTCDGIGGTLKRLAARASLQRSFDHQIMAPHELFTWARDNIQGITVLWVSKKAVQQKSAQLAAWFRKATTVKGTRTYRYFRPFSLTSLCAGVTSFSTTVIIQVSEQAFNYERQNKGGLLFNLTMRSFMYGVLLESTKGCS